MNISKWIIVSAILPLVLGCSEASALPYYGGGSSDSAGQQLNQNGLQSYGGSGSNADPSSFQAPPPQQYQATDNTSDNGNSASKTQGQPQPNVDFPNVTQSTVPTIESARQAFDTKYTQLLKKNSGVTLSSS